MDFFLFPVRRRRGFRKRARYLEFVRAEATYFSQPRKYRR